MLMTISFFTRPCKIDGYEFPNNLNISENLEHFPISLILFGSKLYRSTINLVLVDSKLKNDSERITQMHVQFE